MQTIQSKMRHLYIIKMCKQNISFETTHNMNPMESSEAVKHYNTATQQSSNTVMKQTVNTIQQETVNHY